MAKKKEEKTAKKTPLNTETVARNKKAFFDYEVLEKLEAGIELQGTEIKSIREHKVSLVESYVAIRENQAFVFQMNISPYAFGNINNHMEKRVRRLLLHKKEILRLDAVAKQKGFTLIPLSMYIKKGRAKLELGVCRGKNVYDKRQVMKERDVKREMGREIKKFY